MRAVRILTAWAAFTLAPAFASPASGVPAGEARMGAPGLKAAYVQLRERIARSPYGRPLWLEAREGDHELEGDAYAVIAQPFERVATALEPVGNWCEALILPFNVKHCEATADPRAPRLTLLVGRKGDTPDYAAFRIQFEYALGARGRDYFELALAASEGPLDTRNYRVALQAMALDEGHTFIHLGYSYRYGALSRAAMRTYLATFGASKVGFSSDARGLVGGMRGVMERNTMRYYLAIDAYLASLDAPPGARVAKRLNEWFSATERYPRQLSEDIGRAQYVAMKLRAYARQPARVPIAGG